MENPNRPGSFEFYECIAVYRNYEPAARYEDVSVRSYEGEMVDGQPKLIRKNITWIEPVVHDELRFHSSWDEASRISGQGCYAQRDYF